MTQRNFDRKGKGLAVSSLTLLLSVLVLPGLEAQRRPIENNGEGDVLIDVLLSSEKEEDLIEDRLVEPELLSDEELWSQDPALEDRIAEDGRELVVASVRDDLTKALGRLAAADPIGTDLFTEEEGERALVAIRWAAILGDLESLATLDGLAALDEVSGDAVVFSIGYMARWSAFRIRNLDRGFQESVARLVDLRGSGVENARIFAEDRLLELGAASLPQVVEGLRRDLIPRLDELDREVVNSEDLDFLALYFREIAFLTALLESEESRAAFAALVEGSDDETLEFAEGMLESLDPPPDDE